MTMQMSAVKHFQQQERWRPAIETVFNKLEGWFSLKEQTTALSSLLLKRKMTLLYFRIGLLSAVSQWRDPCPSSVAVIGWRLVPDRWCHAGGWWFSLRTLEDDISLSCVLLNSSHCTWVQYTGGGGGMFQIFKTSFWHCRLSRSKATATTSTTEWMAGAIPWSCTKLFCIIIIVLLYCCIVCS